MVTGMKFDGLQVTLLEECWREYCIENHSHFRLRETMRLRFADMIKRKSVSGKFVVGVSDSKQNTRREEGEARGYGRNLEGGRHCGVV